MWVSENISDFGISSIPVANRCFFLNMKRNTSYSPIIRESFNAKIKQFRTALRGVVDEKFFLFRLAKIYAYPQ